MVNGADVAVGEITVEAAVVMEGVLVVMEVVLVDIAGDSPVVVEVTKFLVVSPTLWSEMMQWVARADMAVAAVVVAE